jgi:hypothetical protein
MSSPRERLEDRLRAIVQVVSADPAGRAVIALGSAGRELKRFDQHSDLDVFVVVDDGHQARYLASLDWLAATLPIAFAFANTRDAFKILFADGFFCELAVFGASELAGIPFAPGRLVWRRADVAADLAEPRVPLPPATLPDPAWSLGEALTNLLVGLHRFHRGERLAAFRLIQVHAVDRVLELAAGRNPPPRDGGPGRDPFARERRAERRHPELVAWLPRCTPGYEQSPAAAAAILAWLEAHFAVPPAMASAIRQLC